MKYRMLVSVDGGPEEIRTIYGKDSLQDELVRLEDQVRALFRAAGIMGECGGLVISVHPDNGQCDHEVHGCAPD